MYMGSAMRRQMRLRVCAGSRSIDRDVYGQGVKSLAPGLRDVATYFAKAGTQIWFPPVDTSVWGESRRLRSSGWQNESLGDPGPTQDKI